MIPLKLIEMKFLALFFDDFPHTQTVFVVYHAIVTMRHTLPHQRTLNSQFVYQLKWSRYEMWNYNFFSLVENKSNLKASTIVAKCGKNTTHEKIRNDLPVCLWVWRCDMRAMKAATAVRIFIFHWYDKVKNDGCTSTFRMEHGPLSVRLPSSRFRKHINMKKKHPTMASEKNTNGMTLFVQKNR